METGKKTIFYVIRILLGQHTANIRFVMKCAFHHAISLLPCKHHVWRLSLSCTVVDGAAWRLVWSDLLWQMTPLPHHHSPWQRALTFPDRSDSGPRWKWSLSLTVFSASLHVYQIYIAYSVITSPDNFVYVFIVLATRLDTYTYKMMLCNYGCVVSLAPLEPSPWLLEPRSVMSTTAPWNSCISNNHK